jgi:hypothetical protein
VLVLLRILIAIVLLRLSSTGIRPELPQAELDHIYLIAPAFNVIRVPLRAAGGALQLDADIPSIQVKLIPDIQVLLLLNLEELVIVKGSLIGFLKMLDIGPWALLIVLQRFNPVEKTLNSFFLLVRNASHHL